MRIAYVCTDPGVPAFGSKGASIHVQSVLKVLVDQGHEVHLVTVRLGGNPVDGVTVHLLSSVGKGATAVREKAAQRSDAEVAAVLDSIRPQWVYERYSLWGRTATQWAARQEVPSVLEVNAPLIEEQATYRQLVDRRAAEAVAVSALTLASGVICVSEEVQQWAQSKSPRPESVHVLANGVDTDRIHPASRTVTPADSDRFTVGFVGTLKAWHGIETLMEAVSDLSGVDPSWRLLLVGDGPMAASLRRLALDLGISDLVEFTGAVSPAEVVGQLHRMDVACAPYPARNDFYFSPLKVYEYLAAGLPVVASAIGQVPRAVNYGSWGILTVAGDTRSLADALRLARRDAAWRSRMRTEARAAAVRHHTWKAVVGRAFALVPGEAA